MKPGDKVWVFEYLNQEIRCGSCKSVVTNGDYVYVAISFGQLSNGKELVEYGHVFGFDCFPTREALCEHYRKIFE